MERKVCILKRPRRDISYHLLLRGLYFGEQRYGSHKDLVAPFSCGIQHGVQGQQNQKLLRM
jgi:hypothetical protein